jgi:hypothetical protein
MKNLTPDISSADFATVVNAHLAGASKSLPGTADAAYLTTLNGAFDGSFTPLAIGQHGASFYNNLKDGLRNSTFSLKYFDENISGLSAVPANAPFAHYFNGKTYIAYAGATDHPYILTYNHSTKDFSTPIRCGTNPNPQDRHQQPTCFVDKDGYIHVFHGCHNSPVLYSRSTNAEDISAWTVKWTDVTSPIASGTYPKVFQKSNGTIYLFYRNSVAHHCYRTSSDGGNTWSEEVVVIQNYYNYGSIAMVNDIIYCTFAYAASSGAYDRKNIVYFYCDINGVWRNISGTEKTLPINPSDCLVFDVGSLSTSDPSISIFGGSPYLAWGVIDESNPSTITYKFAKWGGASWTVITVTSGAIGYVFARATIDVISASVIHVYINKETSVEKWISSDGGATWSKSETVISSASAFIEGGIIVRDGLREARVVVPEFNVTASAYGSKIYLHGDNGIIKNI